jgi:hypothetical protein
MRLNVAVVSSAETAINAAMAMWDCMDTLLTEHREANFPATVDGKVA